MLDARHPQDLPPQVSEWAFDAVAGRISAVDGQGREMMVIAADPLFGPRLAAAFGWPMMAVGTWQQQLRAMSAPPRPAPMLQPVVAVEAAPEAELQA